MARLRKNERCPIHNSYWCCGRERKINERKRYQRHGPVTRIDNEFHPRGYIERRSKAEMRRLVLQKVKEQHGLCGICGKPFEDIEEVVPDHIEPMPAGCKKDDHQDNIQAAHSRCNLEKGSQRNYVHGRA